MSEDETKKESQTEGTSTLGAKALAGLAAISFLFWPKTSQKAELKKSAHSVPRAKNQAGRLEKA